MSINNVKAFLPIDITDARLMSSTVTEPDAAEPAWSAATTYAEFAQVSVVTANSHLVFESLQSGNLNHPPATSPTWWILKSYTNKFRMFEWNNAKPSTGASPLTVAIRPGIRINAVMLSGLSAATATITVQDGPGGATVLSISKDLLNRHATTPYEYCFSPFVYDKVFATFDVAPIIDPVITMTLTDPSGTCSIGRFAIGLSTDIGEVEWNTVVEDENYSEITYSGGFAKITPAQNIPTLQMEVDTPAARVNRVRLFKEQANGKVAIWSAMPGVDSYNEMHVIIGAYQRFRFGTQNLKYTKIGLTIKGV